MNKIEQMKLEKNGLDVLSELPHLIEKGLENISAEDVERLRWLGLFLRKRLDHHFMLRIRIPNGKLTTEQAKTLASLSEDYGRGFLDITSRQGIQLRWIKLKETLEVLEKLEKAGLSSLQTGFDNIRNFMGCPVTGLDREELLDTYPITKELNQMIVGNKEFSNLPRKFNISLCGCKEDCAHADINDIAFVPAKKMMMGKEVLGFNIKLGGALGPTYTFLAVPLNVFVLPEQVLPITRAMLELYRDFGPREKRFKARMMHFIQDWGLERFREEVGLKVDWTLQASAKNALTTGHRKDHIGIHPQKQEGYYYAGLHVPVGRLSSAQWNECIRLAEYYGQNELRLTAHQDIIIPYIRHTDLESFKRENVLQELSIHPPTFMRGTVSCTGQQYCDKAVIETKNRALEVAKELDARLTVPFALNIHWSGCPNSCGQHQVADIGLQGTKTKVDGVMVEAVDIYFGGKLGVQSQSGEVVAQKVPCTELIHTLEQLITNRMNEKLVAHVI